MNIYYEIMYHKEVDHNAAHSKWGNQFLHLVSSLMMIGSVYCLFYETIELCSKIAIVSQMLRQSGHIFIEGNVSKNEVAKIGFNTDMKITAITSMLLIKTLECYVIDSFETFIDFKYMFYYYILTILYRIVYLTFYGEHALQGLVWAFKIMTDIFTDIPLYGCTVFGKTAPKTYYYVWGKKD
jgi:hypothetical protein